MCRGSGIDPSRRGCAGEMGVHFRAARMLSPAGAREVIRAGVGRALKRLPEIPLMPTGRRRSESNMCIRKEPTGRPVGRGATRECPYLTVIAPSARDMAAARFLFARPADALDGPTSLEDYEPPEWLKQASLE